VCSQPRNSGMPCAISQSSITRFYFDMTTGTCRSFQVRARSRPMHTNIVLFQYSQCGGNENNFDTLEQCQGYCLARTLFPLSLS
jgi:hypothetical protein